MFFQEKVLQYLLFCACSICMLQCGFNDGWTSFALPQLQGNNSRISLTNDEGSWLTSTYPIGSIFGSLLIVVTMDVFGRKTTLLIGSLPFCGTWLLIAYARQYWKLVVARFIAGLCDGVIFSCVPVYLAEVCNSNIRGFLITGCKIFYVVGILSVNLLGEFFNIKIAGVICSALSLGVLLCLLVPESPYFYMIKKDDKKAQTSMEKYNKNAKIETLRHELNEQKARDGKWLELFVESSNRKKLLLVIALKLFQQFSGYMCFTYYAHAVFLEMKNGNSPIIFVSIYYVLQIIMLIINGMIIDKIGRRPLIAVSTLTVVVGLFIVSVYFCLQNAMKINVTDYSWYSVFGLFIFIIGYTLGLQNIPDIIISEIFPLHVKSLAVSICGVIFCLSMTAVAKLFQYTRDEFGIHVPFIIFTICTLCSLPIFVLFVPETKRKTLEDIEKSMRNIA